MSKLSALMRRHNLLEVYGIDFETFYDSKGKYSIRRMPTTEYIFDDRFKTQAVAVQKHSWRKAKVMDPTEFRKFARTINWSRAGFLAHHAHFDGLIAYKHFGIAPAYYLDTLSMARPAMPIKVRLSLNTLAKAFGLKGKEKAAALVAVDGKPDLTREEFRALCAYAGDDIEQTWSIFYKLLDVLPDSYLDVVNIAVRMYAQPTLVMRRETLVGMIERVQSSKQALVDELGVQAEQLSKDAQFAELLRAAGVEPPMVFSEKQQKHVLSFSKQNEEFISLRNHANERVRKLVEARLSIKSSSIEKRAERFADRALHGAQPVYYNVWGAKTGRFSGGDKSNYQNLGSKRKDGGKELRESIEAPPGHVLIVSDQGQIEARVNAYISGQWNIIQAFADKRDVYREEASGIYGVPADAITDHQRFLGKACVLALGFQAGSTRFAEMLRVGALGPPVDISDAEAAMLVGAWRRRNDAIVRNWSASQNLLTSAFVGRQTLNHGVLTYVGNGQHGFTMLPGGMAIRYDHISVDHNNKLSYISKVRRNQHGEITYEERTSLYGGIIVENNVQALAGEIVVYRQMPEIEANVKHVRTVLTTHDELVHVVPAKYAEKAQRDIIKIMETPPPWAPDLPLKVDSHITARYDK